MKKPVKIILVILCIIITLIVGIFIIMSNLLKPDEVADYGQRVEIWETVAGNSTRSKLDDMNIDYNKKNLLFATLKFANVIVNDNYADEEQAIDTFTYLYEIKEGFEKETYEDEPYLIPYNIENAKGAVIVIPGGGYGYKSIDGTTGEGKDVALALNEQGYSAFVLHYRSNPYEYPIPQLDVQRAVRYLRANASSYGFAADKIALIGFSAGGNQVGTYINVIMGNDFFPNGYVSDKTDQIDDSVCAVGMIYPALRYDNNVPMLFSSFDADTVRDENERKELLEKLDLSKHFDSSNIPQLVAYGTKDEMVGMDGAKEYISAAKKAKANIVEVVAEGQDHGFKPDYYMEQFVKLLEDNQR